MQTFLPQPNFIVSAESLDKVRLNKQITECYQLLNANLAAGGWSNHPAAKMWAGYEGYLVKYARACFQEFVKRGGTPTHKSWFKIKDEWGFLEAKRPPWLGDKEFHASHRSRLLHKGNLDIIAKQLKWLTKDRTEDYIKSFFGLTRKTPIRELNVLQAASLLTSLAEVNAPGQDNWYGQFGWSESPSDDYIWPV